MTSLTSTKKVCRNLGTLPVHLPELEKNTDLNIVTNLKINSSLHSVGKTDGVCKRNVCKNKSNYSNAELKIIHFQTNAKPCARQTKSVKVIQNP